MLHVPELTSTQIISPLVSLMSDVELNKYTMSHVIAPKVHLSMTIVIKFQPWCLKFQPGCKSSNPGVLFTPRFELYAPKFELLQQGLNFKHQDWNFIMLGTGSGTLRLTA